MINNREWLEFPRRDIEKSITFVFADYEDDDGWLWFSERFPEKRVANLGGDCYLVAADISAESAEDLRDEIDVALVPALMREVPDEWEETLETSFYGLGTNKDDTLYRYLVFGEYE